jgi:hypothetical protein
LEESLMREEATVDLRGLIGRRTVDVEEELQRRDVEVKTDPEALKGVLSLLAAPTSPDRVPPGSRVIAYVDEGRVTRFVLDQVGSARKTLDRHAARLAAVEKDLEGLKASIAVQERTIRALERRITALEGSAPPTPPTPRPREPRRSRGRQSPPTTQ